MYLTDTLSLLQGRSDLYTFQGENQGINTVTLFSSFPSIFCQESPLVEHKLAKNH